MFITCKQTSRISFHMMAEVCNIMYNNCTFLMHKNISECFEPGGGGNVFPGVLQVKFPLFIPELRVVESVEMAVSQP